jgi:hypothetical protein
MRLFITVIFLACASYVVAQAPATYNYNPNQPIDTSKKSIRCMAFAPMDKDSIRIVYYSPAVRRRVIWGGLVPYNDVWVTGAHSATRLDMPRAFMVNGVSIPAGQYALFSIPGETEWTLIINKNWQQHLADDYDQKDDIVRVNVKPQQAAHLERLQYFIESGGQSGKIIMAWEKIRVELPFAFQ